MGRIAHRGLIMEINESVIRHVATLAKIELSDKEVKEFVPQLQEVFESFQKIQQANVKNIEPSFHPIELKNHLRDDEPRASIPQKDALSNVHQEARGYIKAPRAV